MSELMGNVGEKITATVQLVNRLERTDYKFSYYGTTTYTYIMKDQAGNTFVWKTSSLMDFQNYDKYKTGELDFIRKGDWLTISGTVKEHNEYKGEPQTVLTRCKYSLVERAPDPTVSKKQEQMATLGDGDIIWDMPYRQYKEHYSDCETLAGSYNEESGTVAVIIRKGRMKNSGVRGMHFSGYLLENENGGTVCYRAVSEENALRRAEKEFPAHKWGLKRIYAY